MISSESSNDLNKSSSSSSKPLKKSFVEGFPNISSSVSDFDLKCKFGKLSTHRTRMVQRYKKGPTVQECYHVTRMQPRYKMGTMVQNWYHGTTKKSTTKVMNLRKRYFMDDVVGKKALVSAEGSNT